MHALAALSLPAFAVYVVAQSEVGAWGQCECLIMHSLDQPESITDRGN